MNCSTATVQRFEQQGMLTVERTINAEGKKLIRYSADEVEALSKTWVPKRVAPTKLDSELALIAVRGRAAAICFPLFRTGYPLVQIVEMTGLDPMLIRKLRTEFDTSFEEGKKRDREREDIERDERMQKIHDRKRDRAEYREWRVKMAKAGIMTDTKPSGRRLPFFST